ncbi:MAG: pyridoxal-phosphate dependent enzyme [Ardenticatenales bacterium]
MGIWRYAADLAPAVPSALRLTLGEGSTPLEAAPGLARSLGLDALWLKREDRNPTGSHKDRGVAFQVSLARAVAVANGRPLARIALSSSGNAAISAAAYGRLAPIDVVAFVAPDTAPAKLALLREHGAIVVRSPNALTLCQAWCTERDVPNLRPSTDPSAVEGFQTLGWEILTDLAASADGQDAAGVAVFTYVSSATSLVGIGRAFARGSQSGANGAPSLNAVQGLGAASVAGPLDANPPRPGPTSTHETSHAANGHHASVDRPAVSAEGAAPTTGRLGALGARKTRRLGEAHRVVVASGGAGWVITDAQADVADALLRAAGICAAIEGAASLAAAARAAAETGVRRAVVVLTGAARDGDEADSADGADAAADRRSAAMVERSAVPHAAADALPHATSLAQTIGDVDDLVAAHVAAAGR